MEHQFAPMPMGIQILSEAEAQNVNLGPLTQLQGTWKSTQGMGWNVIAVPGPPKQEFILEVIPYIETLTFTPVVAASNRGPFVGNVEQTQQLVGLMYEQIITSTCDTPFCNARGFGSGNMIHAERGIFLNIQNLNSNFDIFRLATIPHGNSVLAPGVSSNALPPNNNFIPNISSMPFASTGRLPMGYGENIYFTNQFPQFDQAHPNSFLTKTLGTNKLTSMTTLSFSTKNTDGGILNIPFIQNNIKTTDMEATFWIESVKNPVAGKPDIQQLQYSQTINLVFPPTGLTLPVVWPHVTVNTLAKIA